MQQAVIMANGPGTCFDVEMNKAEFVDARERLMVGEKTVSVESCYHIDHIDHTTKVGLTWINPRA